MRLKTLTPTINTHRRPKIRVGLLLAEPGLCKTADTVRLNESEKWAPLAVHKSVKREANLGGGGENEGVLQIQTAAY